MWEAAPERKIARSELNEMKELLQANRAPARAPRAPASTPQPKPQPKGNNEVRARVYAELDRILAEEGRVAGPSELQQSIGVAKGYTGGKDGVIKQWMAERGISIPTSESHEEALVDEGVVSEA
jgi:hypothetical protein